MNKAKNKAIIRRPNSALLIFDFGWAFRNWKNVGRRCLITDRAPTSNALDAWPLIDFTDDRDGCLFTATVHRKPVDELILSASSPKSSPKSSSKTDQRIIELIRQDPYTTTEAMGKILGITKRAVLKQVNKLKAQQRLRRVGPARGGYWEVIE